MVNEGTRHLVPLLSPEVATCQLYIVDNNPRIRPTPVGRQTSMLIAKYLSSEDQLLPHRSNNIACTYNKVDKACFELRLVHFETSEMGGVIKHIR